MMTPVNDRYEDDRFASLMAEDQYKRAIAWLEADPLSGQEEARLLRCLEQARCNPDNGELAQGAKSARDCLVEACQPCIYHIAAKMVACCRDTMEVLDLVQEGTIGLLHWLDAPTTSFVASSGGFVFRAVKVVQWAMIEAICERGGQVRIPRSVHRRLKSLQQARGVLFQELGREPSTREIAQHLGVGVEKVCTLLEQWSLMRAKSVEGFCTFDEEEQQDRRDFVSVFAQQEGESNEDRDRKIQMVQRAVTYALPTCQRDVLQLRYDFAGKEGSQRTQAEVGKMLGVSEASVSSSEYSARRRLREVLAPVVEEKQSVDILPFMASTDGYYTYQDAARLLELSPVTIGYYARKGVLSVMMMGRKPWLFKHEVEAFARERSLSIDTCQLVGASWEGVS